MTYAAMLKKMYPDLAPVVDDLFLLEVHQIEDLPNRAPTRELAAVLHAHPRIARFFVSREPALESVLGQLLADHDPLEGDDLTACEQALLWEIADWIVYQRDPAGYEVGAKVDWDLAAVTNIVDIEGKVVIDAGAGTGRVAFAAAPGARHVFAVEPVATLRRYMRQKAVEMSVDNLYVLDGLLAAIPLPADTADVLLTCQAIGWDLPVELPEIERVVLPGGVAMHLFGASSATEATPLYHALEEGGYQPNDYKNGPVYIRSYWKQIGR